MPTPHWPSRRSSSPTDSSSVCWSLHSLDRSRRRPCTVSDSSCSPCSTCDSVCGAMDLRLQGGCRSRQEPRPSAFRQLARATALERIKRDDVRRTRIEHAIEIGQVEAIFRYPVKSMGGDGVEAPIWAGMASDGDRAPGIRRRRTAAGSLGYPRASFPTCSSLPATP